MYFDIVLATVDFPIDLVYPRTRAGLSLINRLTNYIPSWYNYIYDRGTSANSIGDGGGDMYDTGNQVSAVIWKYF